MEVYTPNEPQQPVFFDRTRKRSAWAVAIASVGGLLAAIGAIGLVVTIVLSPLLPDLPLTRAVRTWSGIAPTSRHIRLEPKSARAGADLHTRAQLRFILRRNGEVQTAKRRLEHLIARETSDLAIPAGAISPGHVRGPVRAVFFVNWDKPSLDSLQRHIAESTHLIPEWLRIDSTGGRLAVDRDLGQSSPASDQDDAPETNDAAAQRIARKAGVAILPMVQNYGNDDFQTGWLHDLLSNPALRTAVVGQLERFVIDGHYQGINVDFETDRADDRAGLTAFMTQLAAAFHPLGLLVTEDIQTDSDTYDLPVLSRVNDFLVPMLYDENSDGTPPGPIAANDWYRHELSSFAAQIPAYKIVIGLGNFGYDWKLGHTDADETSFEVAAETAKELGSNHAVIKMDPASGNEFFSYAEGGKTTIVHHVWLEDAATAYNQMRIAIPDHVLGAALWRLGAEDPSLWDFFGKSQAADFDKFNPLSLTNISYNYFGTQFEGEGDILDVVQPPSPGTRVLSVNPHSGLIVGEGIVRYPTQYVIRRTGLVNQITGKNDLDNGAARGYIALTFDDGPDPRWTPQILEILHRFRVPGTFFLVGKNAESFPGIVSDEWNSGMEIGNHSFTHPEMAAVSQTRMSLELDATQRVIEAITGHMTTLFRAPNRADSEPATQADFAPVLEAHKLGYLFIGEQNDPEDWWPGIDSATIVRRVLHYVDSKQTLNDGNCILLHDAGGQTRAQTVKALPLIIEGLEQRGFKFVKVSQLIGRPESQVFPEVTGRQRLIVNFDRAVFEVTYWVGTTLSALFILAIILGIGRILIIGTLAWIQSSKSVRVFNLEYRPSVSVVIAAFNEQQVIKKTIDTLLASEYPQFEILVIDDGSKDETAAVIRREFGDNRRVRLLCKPNGGKASALNLGIRECTGDIIVALDADTVFARDTISRLVSHFEDPEVGAVSGNVKVGNRNNMLTAWQAIEYITSQNFDRRAFDLLNCITVVPGAVGAWRRDAVILAGLYSSATLAEDTDLTFKVRKLGYRLVTDNQALAFTEAPDTLSSLAKQRYRWAFGTLQCLWKHRSSFLSRQDGTFGLIAIPSLWIYQIGFQAIAPMVDLAILWSVFYNLCFAPNQDMSNLIALGGYWLLLSSVEFLGALLAFKLDREDCRLLFLLPLQRFVYRQLMYYVVIKSIVSAIRGSVVGWGKLERKGTVVGPTDCSVNSQVPEPAGKL